MREADRGLRGFSFAVPPDFNYRFDNRDGRESRRFEYRTPDNVVPFVSGSRGRLGVTVQSLTPELEGGL